MDHNVKIIAVMKGVGPIGPNDAVFLLVKRNTSNGETMSREQYPAISVVQTPVAEDGSVAAGASNSVKVKPSAAATIDEGAEDESN